MNYVGLFNFRKMDRSQLFMKLPSSIKNYFPHINVYYEESTSEIYINVFALSKGLISLSCINNNHPNDNHIYLDETFKLLTDEECMSILSSKDILVYRKEISGELFVRLYDDNNYEVTPMYNPKTGSNLTYEDWKKEFK